MPDSISKSGLWKMQEDYYRTMGVRAWDDRTPFYVTNSLVIAEAYAHLILSFLLDFPVDPEEPLYLLELGTGTGRFGYHLTRELKRKLACFPQTRDVRFTLVMTDVVKDNLRFWEAHERLAPLGEHLDFALFRPEHENTLKLRKSGKTLERVKNPLIVLANYFFDSIRHDEFHCDQGRVEECLIDIVRKPKLMHSTRHRLDIRDVEVQRTYRPVDPETRYDNPEWNRILCGYRDTVQAGAVTLPVGGLRSLANLRSLG
ncbi:MAG: hypothetical protein AB1758_36775, partial [Candidatus Eremiobacterota bacterium]